MQKSRISIIGMGFVGLVTATCLANRGYNVIATTLESELVEKVNKGIAPFYEKDLDELLKIVINNGNLRASIDNKQALLNSEISLIS